MIESAYPIVNGLTINDLINKLKNVIKVVVIPAFIALLIGLAVYDAQSGAFPTPLHHLDFILSYHAGLTYQEPSRVELQLSWIIPPISRQPAAYYVVTFSPPGWQPIGFWGVSSPLWWSIWLIIQLIYNFIKNNRPVKNPSIEVIILAWIIATYGSFILLGYIYQRWVYLFYFLQVSLLMAFATPYILEENGYTLLLKILIAIQILWFVMWFPVKPEWFLEFNDESRAG